MKIGILTYYFVHNHGAILQAYGMQCVLEQLGHEATFLTFSRNYDHMEVGADKKYNLSIKSVPLLFNYFLSNGAGTFYYNYKKRNQLHLFKKQYMKMGERYSDAEQDAVLIGSDEVFAIDVGINPFLYGHDIPVNNIFSYAASFGSSEIYDIEKAGCKELIGSGLKKLKNIGVRDVCSYNIVKELSGRDATINCDPVILYGYKKELKSLQTTKFSDKYILIYSYDRNFNASEDIETIREFARRNNFKIWSVGYYHKWSDKNIMCSPIEMLKYFKNAEVVITDTFHGSVVSIITNTPLIVRLAKKNQKVDFLLEQYGLQNRRTNVITDIDKIFEEKIDYKRVNEVVEIERTKSLQYLRNSLVN